MFKVGHMYTHKNMLDVCMFVIRVDHLQFSDFFDLTVRWFTRNGLDLNSKDTIQIKDVDVERWYEYAGKN